MTPSVVSYLLPELALMLAATGIYLAGAFWPGRRGWSISAIGAIVVAGGLLMRQSLAGSLGPLAADDLAGFVRGLSLVIGLLFLLISIRNSEGYQGAELAGTLLLATVGLMLVGSAGELVLLFLGLELISIPTYVLLYIGRVGPRGQEATAKYFFLSILSSALFLYGLSFVYGIAGSTELAVIRDRLHDLAAGGKSNPLLAVGTLLILGGLGFKIAAAPFHFYAPDVYQGTSHANAGLLAVLPKVAGMIVLARLLISALPDQQGLAWRAVLLLAILTMTLGNVLALWQRNIRRLLAYSSIAHAGYLLIGLAVAVAGDAAAQTVNGASAVLVYLVVYSLATAGTFAALEYLSPAGRSLDDVDELAGVARQEPLAALAISVCMFSLAGVPPLAGFWGKLGLFGSAIAVEKAVGPVGHVQGWFLALAVIGVLNAAVAAAYYLRLVAAMYFRPAPEKPPEPAGGLGAWGAMALAAALLLVIGLFPRYVLHDAARAATSLRRMPVPSVVLSEQKGSPR